MKAFLGFQGNTKTTLFFFTYHILSGEMPTAQLAHCAEQMHGFMQNTTAQTQELTGSGEEDVTSNTAKSTTQNT